MVLVKVIIMAGGKGERFWPYSRVDRPKQFLSVVGGKSLLQQTVARAEKLVTLEDIYIITGEEYVHIVKEQISQLPVQNVIVEPVGRDTAPCIGLGYTYLRDEPGSTVMLVLPADHLVINEERFCAVMERAAEAAYRERKLVTIGLQPTRPETGYGYIRCGAPIAELDGVHEVLQFTEKPDVETAIKFLQSGEYLWNSGMFAWRLDVINEAYRRFLPEIYTGLKKIAEAIGTRKEKEVLERVFPTLPRISVDYGIMEKSEDVLVVPGDFGWDDLGSWTALERVEDPDENGNIVYGNALLVDTSHCIIRSSNKDKLLATLGLEGVVVVDTEDVLLVADKSRTADLKKLITELKEHGLHRYLAKRQSREEAVSLESDVLDLKESVLAQLVTKAIEENAEKIKQLDKPWGREIWWAVTEDYVGKLIEVKAGHSLSLQYHEEKRESMLFIKGSGVLELDGKKFAIKSGLIVDVLPGMVHRVNADTDVAFLEVSTPQTDDVVRLEDHYGRAGKALPGS
ncbi:mannose-1-phosphate guanylyltransferase [Calderihabitans maritimus]|uniref:mannose-1-phosphate guanylyltransferase n=1 Tax=Calderihabitans maritimus TaxID=1246530 RepID=A0A1Z5HXF8_9FIRM|nr:mannose-1-phosphate guanylyltransferase [Calderihabitans maritimus]GAW94021.1 mannose-1-phosphate guanylyltransferase [Calderihabitans maritimus]